MQKPSRDWNGKQSSHTLWNHHHLLVKTGEHDNHNTPPHISVLPAPGHIIMAAFSLAPCSCSALLKAYERRLRPSSRLSWIPQVSCLRPILHLESLQSCRFKQKSCSFFFYLTILPYWVTYPHHTPIKPSVGVFHSHWSNFSVNISTTTTTTTTPFIITTTPHCVVMHASIYFFRIF